MEKQFKGTPKPWVLDFSHPEETIINIFAGDYGSGGENWANFTTYNAKDSETQKANALLISKAPEMLEMLQKCEYWISACNENANILKDITTLINSATKI